MDKKNRMDIEEQSTSIENQLPRTKRKYKQTQIYHNLKKSNFKISKYAHRGRICFNLFES
jgi:hypothetical protein